MTINKFSLQMVLMVLGNLNTFWIFVLWLWSDQSVHGISFLVFNLQIGPGL